MATIVLDYDVHNVHAQKALDLIVSLGLFKVKKKKTGIETALESAGENDWWSNWKSKRSNSIILWRWTGRKSNVAPRASLHDLIRNGIINEISNTKT